MGKVSGKIRLGYSASNVSLRLQSGKELRAKPISIGQIHNRFKTNLECLQRILGWNTVNKVRLFRIGTHFITHPHRFAYQDLFREFAVELETVRALAADNGMRLTIHGITESLGSPEHVKRLKALKHLAYCSDILDAVGSDDSVIVQHLGGEYGHHFATRERVVQVISELPDKVRKRLVLENDHKWSVADVSYVAQKAKCGFVYDIFHHKCFPFDAGFTSDNIQSALRTVKNQSRRMGKTPKVHISSQNSMRSLGAHADMIDYRDYTRLRQNINEVGFQDIDIMVEASLHEQAVLGILSQMSVRKPAWSLQREGILY